MEEIEKSAQVDLAIILGYIAVKDLTTQEKRLLSLFNSVLLIRIWQEFVVRMNKLLEQSSQR